MNKEEMKKNIQIGDAFLEKLLCEACLEITKHKLVEGMQDMGAGGVLCATLEVVQRGREKTNKNFGCEIWVDKIPTKHNMTNCDKLISESQERMLIVATKKNRDKIFKIFSEWDLEFETIGIVNTSGKYIVKSLNNKIYEKDFNTFEVVEQDWELKELNYQKESMNFVSNSELWNRYDSTIGCRTLLNNRSTKDDFNNYSLINIYEIDKTLIISWGSKFELCYNSIVNNNYKPLGLVNCLNYGHPEDSMGEMKKFLEDLTIKCKKFEVPVLGGNVSLYNATNDLSINPCPILIMIGIN
jgi:phosphoribosylformylglycinamidine synthase